MKFLIDNNVSPLLADALKAAGHDAVHLRDLGMQAATDHIVLGHGEVVAEDASAPSRHGPPKFGDPDVDEGGWWLRRFSAQVTVSWSTASKALQT